MIGKSKAQSQMNLFKPILKQFINPNHPLVLLAEELPWKELEADFMGFYSNTGTPSHPARMMIGLLLIKQMYDLSDESVIEEWIRDPYLQYFCGETEFQWTQPCASSDLTHFRKRIGTEGVNKILKLSVDMHKIKKCQKQEVLVDTTTQEKNITFPTDVKLYTKIASQCNEIAKEEGLELRQSYTRTIKNLLIEQRFSHHPKRQKQAAKAKRRLKTVTGRLVRDVERNLSEDARKKYAERLHLFNRVLLQQRGDSNKVYSLHEPDVSCIAKGKSHKPYEFGSKVCFAVLPKINIIVGVRNFKGNPHDSQTLEPTLQHGQSITGVEFVNAIVDRGFRGKKKVGNTNVIIPSKKTGTLYEQQVKRRKCRSRAAIEPVIGHVKFDCRMVRNYLKGTVGDEINAILAAAAFNFRKLLRKIEQKNIFSLLGFWSSEKYQIKIISILSC